MTNLSAIQAAADSIQKRGGIAAVTRPVPTQEIYMKTDQVASATTADLIAFYNAHSTTPVKKFTDRKTAERRVTALIEQMPAPAKAAKVPEGHKAIDLAMAAVHAKPAKKDETTPEQRAAFLAIHGPNLDGKPAKKAKKVNPEPVKPSKVNPKLLDFLNELTAKEDAPSATAIIRQALETYPDTTRIEIRNTAKAAGINPLTARNTFDRVRSAK